MSETSLETEVMDEEQLELQTRPESESQVEAQAQAEQKQVGQAAGSGVLALSTEEFTALEERILRTVELVKRERQAHAEAEERAVLAEVQVAEQTPQIANLQTEVQALRSERENVRQRVERLVAQLDALEL